MMSLPIRQGLCFSPIPSLTYAFPSRIRPASSNSHQGAEVRGGVELEEHDEPQVKAAPPSPRVFTLVIRPRQLLVRPVISSCN